MAGNSLNILQDDRKIILVLSSKVGAVKGFGRVELVYQPTALECLLWGAAMVNKIN